MKPKVVKLSKKEKKKLALQMAGPVNSWVTKDERNIYIQGIMDVMERFEFRVPVVS
jgi:hypothetical protein